jgi:Ca2+-binding EF-hand superfamily protein
MPGLDPLRYFNAHEVSEFKEIFDLFDSDGGGSIDSSELGSVMRTLGKNPSPEELATLVKEIDADGSGEIEFDEFLTLLIYIEDSDSGPSDGQLQAMFNKIDLTKKGTVTWTECSSFFSKLASVGGTFLGDEGYDDPDNLDKSRLQRAEAWDEKSNRMVMNCVNGLKASDAGGGVHATIDFEHFCQLIRDLENKHIPN